MEDRSNSRHGEACLRMTMLVPRQRGYMVALSHPGRHERRGEFAYPLREFAGKCSGTYPRAFWIAHPCRVVTIVSSLPFSA